jgi:hypothetical protein
VLCAVAEVIATPRRPRVAKRFAAATTNKTRGKKGETKKG